MNKCKPFIGYHDPETCVFYQRIPGKQPLPTTTQLIEQWRRIEASLMIAVSSNPPEEVQPAADDDW